MARPVRRPRTGPFGGWHLSRKSKNRVGIVINYPVWVALFTTWIILRLFRENDFLFCVGLTLAEITKEEKKCR